MKRTHILSMAGMIGFLCFAEAQADMLLKPVPDIFSSYIDVVYDAGSDALAATGWASTFRYNTALPPAAIGGSQGFSITAAVDETGQATSGHLLITGSIDDPSVPEGTLLEGDLTGFKYFDTGSDRMEFLFTVTGGSLSSTYFPAAGSTVGVILSCQLPSSVSGFTSSFDNLNGLGAGGGEGVADTGVPVPAPAAWVLVLVGTGLIHWIKRQHS